MVDLFARGPHVLSSGLVSDFKIDCDALSDDDICCIAAIIAPLVSPFGEVEGVPRGGTRLALALAEHATKGGLLIVDDVWTTGESMGRHRNGRDARGAVIFARSKPHPWVIPLFQMASTDRDPRGDFDTDVARFCEEAGIVRPNPMDDRAVSSFASWFVSWKYEGTIPRV